MANATTEQRIGRAVDEEEEQLVHHHREQGVVTRRDASKRVSRLAVEGGVVVRPSAEQEEEDAEVRGRRRSGGGGGVVEERRTVLPPPHAWLAIEDTKNKHHHDISDPEEDWLRLLRGGAGSGSGDGRQQRRSSFSAVRRERAAREAWLDRAWEMKRRWHARNGGAPVGKAAHAAESSEPSMTTSSPPHHHAPGAVGVAMDMEEVRACRDLGLDLPSDCAVEIQCYGLSDGGSPAAHSSSGGGADSPPCAGFSSPGEDPMDVKARLKVWAHAVALTSTTQLGS